MVLNLNALRLSNADNLQIFNSNHLIELFYCKCFRALINKLRTVQVMTNESTFLKFFHVIEVLIKFKFRIQKLKYIMKAIITMYLVGNKYIVGII